MRGILSEIKKTNNLDTDAGAKQNQSAMMKKKLSVLSEIQDEFSSQGGWIVQLWWGERIRFLRGAWRRVAAPLQQEESGGSGVWLAADDGTPLVSPGRAALFFFFSFYCQASM